MTEHVMSPKRLDIWPIRAVTYEPVEFRGLPVIGGDMLEPGDALWFTGDSGPGIYKVGTGAWERLAVKFLAATPVRMFFAVGPIARPGPGETIGAWLGPFVAGAAPAAVTAVEPTALKMGDLVAVSGQALQGGVYEVTNEKWRRRSDYFLFEMTGIGNLPTKLVMATARLPGLGRC